jgi:hypothetical protein
MAIACVYLAAPLGATVGRFRMDHMSVRAVNKLGGAFWIRRVSTGVDAASIVFAGAAALAVVGIDGGAAGIDLNEAIFGVVSVGVRAVVDEVARRIV